MTRIAKYHKIAIALIGGKKLDTHPQDRYRCVA